MRLVMKIPIFGVLTPFWLVKASLLQVWTGKYIPTYGEVTRWSWHSCVSYIASRPQGTYTSILWVNTISLSIHLVVLEQILKIGLGWCFTGTKFANGTPNSWGPMVSWLVGMWFWEPILGYTWLWSVFCFLLNRILLIQPMSLCWFVNSWICKKFNQHLANRVSRYLVPVWKNIFCMW